MCTPKGTRTVEGFLDHLEGGPEYRYATIIDRQRSIAFHAHPSVPPYPDSHGCVRLEPYAARLIHDNSIAGKTEIIIDGTWTNPISISNEAVADSLSVVGGPPMKKHRGSKRLLFGVACLAIYGCGSKAPVAKGPIPPGKYVVLEGDDLSHIALRAMET